MTRSLLVLVIAAGLSGCVSTVVGATARAVIPGDSKEDEEAKD